MTKKAIPFVDLHAQYRSLKPEIDAAISDVIENSLFIRGPYVDKFERMFADATGGKHCVSCANGTDAIYIALTALKLREGDEVIVPAMSWISTSETVTQAGGKVVFCDIEPRSYTLDPEQLEACITPRTVGIIPVHLYGHPARMDRIMGVAAKHNLWVVEDCAQAHLAEIAGRQVGSFGVAATYSFYPGKNLGAMGDAGAILTGNDDLAAFMTKFARHGGLKKGDHEIEGINSRLDGLQAAILAAKLPHLRDWTAARRQVAAWYKQRLEHTPGLVCPSQDPECNPVWHLYVVRTEQRNALASYLNAQGIQTSINYPRALPFLPCYQRLGHSPSDFPVAYELQEQCLALPIYAEMGEDDVDYVCQHVRQFLRE